MRLQVCTTIPATPDDLWAELESIPTHVEWMADAESVEMLDGGPSGVGTRFRVVTRVGPIRLDDTMSVTRWEPGVAMGIAHEGVVTGVGEFTLTGHARGTRFCWEERLRFPWWLGGPIGEMVARPVLATIWRANLRRLREQVSNRNDDR